MKSPYRRLVVACGFVLVLFRCASDDRFPVLSVVACRASETAPTASSAGAAQAAYHQADSKPAANMKQYAQEIRDLLEAGFQPGQRNFEAARIHYQAAHDLCATDPRLYHASGLILLRQSNNEEALVKFRLATQQQTGPLYAAGWQSLIRLEAATGRYSEALESLSELAKVLEQSETSVACQPAKEDCAEWMGRMIAYLMSIDSKSQPVKEAAAKANTEICTALATERRCLRNW